jgi:hypothetical protein
MGRRAPATEDRDGKEIRGGTIRWAGGHRQPEIGAGRTRRKREAAGALQPMFLSMLRHGIRQTVGVADVYEDSVEPPSAEVCRTVASFY